MSSKAWLTSSRFRRFVLLPCYYPPIRCISPIKTREGRMTGSQTLEKMAEGIAQGEYSLLLGAGASLGAVGGNGLPLPTSAGLRDSLVHDFELKTGGEPISLARAYDHLHRNIPEGLTKYLREWFRECQPTWQHIIAEFNWLRIWTFNIDDVIEQAYKREGRSAKSLTWDERFSERDSSNSQQIIHLHGMADRLKEGREEKRWCHRIFHFGICSCGGKSPNVA